MHDANMKIGTDRIIASIEIANIGICLQCGSFDCFQEIVELCYSNNKNIKRLKNNESLFLIKHKQFLETAYIKWFRSLKQFNHILNERLSWKCSAQQQEIGGSCLSNHVAAYGLFRKSEERTKQWLLKWLTAKGLNRVDYSKVHQNRDCTVHKFRASLSASSNVKFKHIHRQWHPHNYKHVS
jgi:hypothetical protein